jgi:hypothetical protein
MASRGHKIEPIETTDRYGNVTLTYDVRRIDPEGEFGLFV